MIKKIMVIGIIAILTFTVFAVRPVNAAPAETINGTAFGSEQDGDWYTDPSVEWLNESGNNWNGNITVIDLDDPDVDGSDSDTTGPADDAINAEGLGTDENGYDDFGWDASTGEPRGWYTPPVAGSNLLFVGQYNGIADGLNNNYVFCGHITADGDATPQSSSEFSLKYEPIPTPTVTNVGGSYINVSIPHFKYTDYNLSAGGADNRGTYHCFKSYAVYIKGGEFSSWTYQGNSQLESSGPDSPLVAYNAGIDPNTIDTGSEYFNATGLAGGSYQIAVAPNFDVPGQDNSGVWGEGGGRGSITLYQKGAPTGSINTPEFEPGIFIPVVATIGMFAAITIYRKKKNQ